MTSPGPGGESGVPLATGHDSLAGGLGGAAELRLRGPTSPERAAPRASLEAAIDALTFHRSLDVVGSLLHRGRRAVLLVSQQSCPSALLAAAHGRGVVKTRDVGRGLGMLAAAPWPALQAGSRGRVLK